MADDADKPNKPTDENENLVKALESIKTLLATSETKLSQARESISQASAHSLKMTTEVPVLDDVVVPGKPPPEAKQAEEDKQSGADHSADALSALQARLETEMHEKLLNFTQQLELELKQKIKDYIEQYGKPHTDE